MQKIKWYSETTIVDVETGEIITKSFYERNNYFTIIKEKTYEYKDEKNGRIGIAKWLHIAKQSGQQNLQFGE